jgi:hypothetical protein
VQPLAGWPNDKVHNVSVHLRVPRKFTAWALHDVSCTTGHICEDHQIRDADAARCRGPMATGAGAIGVVRAGPRKNPVSALHSYWCVQRLYRLSADACSQCNSATRPVGAPVGSVAASRLNSRCSCCQVLRSVMQASRLILIALSLCLCTLSLFNRSLIRAADPEDEAEDVATNFSEADVLVLKEASFDSAIKKTEYVLVRCYASNDKASCVQSRCSCMRAAQACDVYRNPTWIAIDDRHLPFQPGIENLFDVHSSCCSEL